MNPFTFIANLFASPIIGSITSTIKSLASETTVRTVAAMKYGASVTTTGIQTTASLTAKAMNQNVYWWAWGTAALFTVGYYAWWMADTMWGCPTCMLPGKIPHVAPLQVGLKEYYDTVWGNIFGWGAAGYGIHTAGRVLDRLVQMLGARK